MRVLSRKISSPLLLKLPPFSPAEKKSITIDANVFTGCLKDVIEGM